ncbi:MAG: hypothetical protein HXX13_18070 [Bacteroidetes bacterium]|nr:hypothetical protein [Bacteroidota bacterium]
MKKTHLIIVTLIFAGFTFLTSCTKDKTPPTINFKGGSAYTSSDVTVDAGSTLKFGITATNGSSKLERFKIVATSNNTPITVVDTTFSSDSFNQDYSFEFPDAGESRLTFTITDKDGQTADLNLTVTTEAPINSYTAVLLGGQLNPDNGSFYSTADNSVLKLSEARTNPEKADMVYYYGSTNMASIVAISDAQLLAVPAFAECDTWNPKNATLLKLTSGVDWTTITNGTVIGNAVSGLTDTHVNQLNVGDIIAFQTASTSSNPSKKGLFKVLEINGTTGADRSIKIEVKIQK